MSELINGRTPEEIKRNLSYLVRCENCPQNHEYGCDYDKQTEECRTVNDALVLIERLEAKVPKWISVKERLPEFTDVYLIHAVHRYNKNDGYRCMNVRMFFKGEFEQWQGLPDIYEVTHWMHLPEPPKEEANA